MPKTGVFQIQGCFKLVSRGLVLFGQILEGRVKVGSYLTFHLNGNTISLKIGGVEMMDNISTKEFWVGLTFVYKDEQERDEFKQLKIEEQLAEVTDMNVK